jgi:hypothetical protein
MTFGQMLRNVSVGLLFGILAIGLLPFLVIFNWAEMLNLVELETSPLFMLLGRFFRPTVRKKSKNSVKSMNSQEHKQDLNQ